MSLKTEAKRGTVVLISTILISSIAVSGISGAMVTSPGTHATVNDSSTTAANTTAVSIRQQTGLSTGNGDVYTRHPAIQANTSLTFDNGTNYEFLVTNEDTGESITLAINESVEIPADQTIGFILYNADGTPRDFIYISSLGSLSTEVISGSVSAASGPTNFSIALLNASSGNEIARTETKPSLIAYSGTVSQNSTTGKIRLSAPKDVLAGNSSAKLEIYREGERFSAPHHPVEMEYEPATDEYVGVIDASEFAAGTYDWTLYLYVDGWEAKHIVSNHFDFNLTISPAPKVKVNPASRTVRPTGQAVRYELVLTNADGGVGGHDNITVSVNDTDVATFNSITSNVSASANSGISSDASSAFVNVPFGGDTNDTGDVTLATFTVTANAEGLAAIDVNVTGDISKENGKLYNISAVENGTLTVSADAAPPAVVGTDPPTNLDGDGQFEDVNGNGGFDIGDVQALYANQNSDAVQNNVDAFDFNGNGEIDIGDVQALYTELQNS